MKRATAVAARPIINVEGDLFPGEVLREREAIGLIRLLGLRARRADLARFSPGDVGVEILKAQMQLVGIKPLRSAAELAALELVNDQPELVDLTIAPILLGDQVTDQLMKQRRVAWQVVEVEAHERFYSQRDS
jgi:hypothetical protein